MARVALGNGHVIFWTQIADGRGWPKKVLTDASETARLISTLIYFLLTVTYFL
jgi:hypothetical protein